MRETNAPKRPPLRLNAKEAAMLWMAMETNIHEGIGWLSPQKLAALAGAQWEEKLGAMRLKMRASDTPEGRRGLIPLDAEPLRYISESPVEPREISIMVSRRFNGAEKALKFIKRRLENEEGQDMRVMCDEGFMQNFLGPLWAERLQAAGLNYDSDTRDGQPQTFISMEALMAFAGKELQEAVDHEIKHPAARHYGRNNTGSTQRG